MLARPEWFLPLEVVAALKLVAAFQRCLPLCLSLTCMERTDLCEVLLLLKVGVFTSRLICF